ncbi:MAG: M6 family metalloprotease domain-containing protein, partial [Fibrobacter sp.]|nr:M6 family metalloprotease domain-containing protein [Fibrobacter sp.]
QSWPSEAMPKKFDNHRGAKFLMNRTTLNAAEAELSHYSSPKGKIYGLTMLVDFSDSPANVTADEILDWLNKEGFNRDGCNGSVRDYYLDVSNGQLDLTNDVVGWYRAKHPKDWYESLPGYSGSDSLVKEVFAYFDGEVDFSRYDNDNDGYAEVINIVYAGGGKTWGQGLWPHSGWANEKRDGVRLQNHQMSDMPGTFSIYVFVHESGHMIFGWPDLYWYGDYCTMGNRADDWNPVAINDFFRADQGWIPFVDVTADDVGRAVSDVGEKCYRFKNPSRPSEEGLVWSYVKNEGRNKALAGSGLLMQHYDFSIEGNTSADALGLRIVHANSKGQNADKEKDQWPNPGSNKNAFFQPANYNEFSDAFYPAIRWYGGVAIGLKLSDIEVSENKLTFCLGGDCTKDFETVETPIDTNVVDTSSTDSSSLALHEWVAARSLKGVAAVQYFDLRGNRLETIPMQRGRYIVRTIQNGKVVQNKIILVK